MNIFKSIEISLDTSWCFIKRNSLKKNHKAVILTQNLVGAPTDQNALRSSRMRYRLFFNSCVILVDFDIESVCHQQFLLFLFLIYLDPEIKTTTTTTTTTTTATTMGKTLQSGNFSTENGEGSVITSSSTTEAPATTTTAAPKTTKEICKLTN